MLLKRTQNQLLKQVDSMTLQEIKDANNAYLEQQQNKQSSGYHNLKLKDLRKLIANTYTMDENTPVLVERIEDKYFEMNGWDTYKNLDGMSYDSHIRLKEELLQEGWMEEYPKLTQEHRDSIINQSEADFYTEQFYAAWCIIADKENKIIKIHSHY